MKRILKKYSETVAWIIGWLIFSLPMLGWLILNFGWDQWSFVFFHALAIPIGILFLMLADRMVDKFKKYVEKISGSKDIF